VSCAACLAQERLTPPGCGEGGDGLHKCFHRIRRDRRPLQGGSACDSRSVARGLQIHGDRRATRALVGSRVSCRRIPDVCGMPQERADARQPLKSRSRLHAHPQTDKLCPTARSTHRARVHQCSPGRGSNTASRQDRSRRTSPHRPPFPKGPSVLEPAPGPLYRVPRTG